MDYGGRHSLSLFGYLDMNAVNYGSGSNEMGGMNQYNGNTMYGGNSFNSNMSTYTGTGATGSPLPVLLL